MEIRLHDSATRALRRLEPLEAGHVRLYVCGPTVYDRAHLGNARPAVVFDVLTRLLRAAFPRVTYVRNITDVDDKINAQARATGRSIADITAETTALFRRDLAALGCLPPDVEPTATSHIPEMIALAERLVAAGHAYVSDGHVLFRVASDPAYGSLSGRSPEELRAGGRAETAPGKRAPEDFVLWKPSDADTPGWDSPWGRGRPGWHIECSAMSWRHLGPDFDLHGGGSDLLFPHHENEAAQSRCAFPGHGFARQWMHNGMVLVAGRKMSKSLGNFLTVGDLLARGPWAAEALRLLLLQTHYRADLDFTDAALLQARRILDRLQRARARLTGAEASDADVPHPAEPVALEAALADDLNTPQAIAALHAIADAAMTAETDAERGHLAGRFLRAQALLGILRTDPEAWAKGEEGTDEGAIAQAIAARQEARQARDFAEADRIRAALAAQGILLEDGPAGTTWRRA